MLNFSSLSLGIWSSLGLSIYFLPSYSWMPLGSESTSKCFARVMDKSILWNFSGAFSIWKSAPLTYFIPMSMRKYKEWNHDNWDWDTKFRLVDNFRSIDSSLVNIKHRYLKTKPCLSESVTRLGLEGTWLYMGLATPRDFEHATP